MSANMIDDDLKTGSVACLVKKKKEVIAKEGIKMWVVDEV